MKKLVPILVVVSLVSCSVISAGWFERKKVQAQQAGRRLGQKMGIIEKTPLEQLQEGAQQMQEGVVSGITQLKEDVTAWGKGVQEQTKATLEKAKNKLSLLQKERDAAKRKFEAARKKVEKEKGKLDSLKVKLDKAKEKCKNTPFPQDIIVCRERDALQIAFTAAQGAFAVAQAVLVATEQVYKKLLQGIETASRAVIDAAS